MTNEQIANKLGISKANVASYLSAAKKHIKRIVSAFTLLFLV